MTGLGPNLKDRLVGPSLTGGNCHFHILPDNICPSHRVVLHLLHLHIPHPPCQHIIFRDTSQHWALKDRYVTL